MSTLLRPLKWFYHEFGIVSIHDTGRNAYLIIVARTCRMFAFGTNALILAIFFSALGYSDHEIGLFMTLTLLGDVFLGTLLTLVADKIGRRRVLFGGSCLMILSGLIFAFFENFWILLGAAILGVVSVTGGDFGPFRSIEESVLSQLTTPSTRADVLSWYVAVSNLGSALGSEASGRFVQILQNRDGWSALDAYHILFLIYTAMGVVNVLLVLALTEECELQANEKSYVEIPQDELQTVSQRTSPRLLQTDSETYPGWSHKAKMWLTGRLVQISGPTRAIMYKLWVLLAVDSLADGMVPYSLTNYYMDIKFHPAKSTLGDITSVSYFLGAIGSTFAGPLARKIGLINTMVFTHVPSSAAVLVFPFPSHLWMTAGLLLLRTALNPLDQAPRSAFIAAVVKPNERTAVMGITAMIRTLASMAGPSVTGILAASERFWIAFVAAGIFRLAYDFGLWALFVNIKVDRDDETTGSGDTTSPATVAATTANNSKPGRWRQRKSKRRLLNRDDEEEQRQEDLEMELYDLTDSDSGSDDVNNYDHDDHDHDNNNTRVDTKLNNISPATGPGTGVNPRIVAGGANSSNSTSTSNNLQVSDNHHFDPSSSSSLSSPLNRVRSRSPHPHRPDPSHTLS